jgi:hypothetical protein
VDRRDRTAREIPNPAKRRHTNDRAAQRAPPEGSSRSRVGDGSCARVARHFDPRALALTTENAMSPTPLAKQTSTTPLSDEDKVFLDFIIKRAIESSTAEARARRRKERHAAIDDNTV